MLNTHSVSGPRVAMVTSSAEPAFEAPPLGARGGPSLKMIDRGMYGEQRRVTACEREETKVLVPVRVNDSRLPSAKSSPYPEGSRIRERANRT